MATLETARQDRQAIHIEVDDTPRVERKRTNVTLDAVGERVLCPGSSS